MPELRLIGSHQTWGNKEMEPTSWDPSKRRINCGGLNIYIRKFKNGRVDIVLKRWQRSQEENDKEYNSERDFTSIPEVDVNLLDALLDGLILCKEKYLK